MAQSNGGTYSLSGTVVNSETGEPIRNSLVTLWKRLRPEELKEYQEMAKAGHLGGVNAPRTALSGATGDYQFTGLAEGRYRVTAQKPGFGPQVTAEDPEYGWLDLSAAASSVTVKLPPLGVIEGRVVDQDGEAIDSVRIEAFTSNIADGARSTTSVRTVVTNDCGLFRMWNLGPGQYYLKATGRGGGTYMYVGDGSSRPQPWLSFRPVYAGGARTLDSATPVTIGAGTQARADFLLTMEPSLRIRGSLENFTAHQNVTFSLRQSGEEVVAPSRVDMNGSTGQFEIQGVVAGDYTLTALQGQTARGEIAVHVSDDGIGGLVLPLWPAVTVSVSVRTVGERQPRSEEADEGSTARWGPGCTVSLHSSDGATPMYPRGQMAGQGDFTIPNVFAGEYRVQIDCGGGYVQSAMAGAADLLSNPRIAFQPGATPPPIEVTMKFGGGAIHGTLAVKPTKSQAGVLAVPTSASSTGPVFLPVIFDPDSSNGGDFGIDNLAPGDYLLYGFSAFEGIEFRNPSVLQALTGGTSVHVEEGKSSEVTLKTVVK